MKKLFAVVLSAAMLLTGVLAFSACGRDHSKYLYVATNAYFPPFEYMDGNAFTGVDIQIASMLAEKMGKTLFVEDMEFDTVITSVQNGNCKIGMAGITVNDKRKEQADFTTEYYESAQVVITKAGDTSFDACKTAADIESILKTKGKDFVIGTQVGTTGFMYSAGDEGFGYEGFDNLTTKAYSTGALAVKDIVNNKCDVVIIDKQPAIMIAEATSGVVVHKDIELTSEAYAFCVQKGDKETLDAANALLKEITDNGKLAQIINSFFDGSSEFKYNNPEV